MGDRVHSPGFCHLVEHGRAGKNLRDIPDRPQPAYPKMRTGIVRFDPDGRDIVRKIHRAKHHFAVVGL
ncbi:hypothetical protein D3C87_2103250 [compost metagenome]